MKKRLHNLLGPVVLIVLFTAATQAQRVMPYYDGITDGNRVTTMLEYNGQLVMGGSFNAFNGHERRNLQGWDGTDHYDYPGAFEQENSDVNNMVIFNGDLIVIGKEVDYYGVALWDGSGWNSMGMAFPTGNAVDLCVLNGELFVVGIDSNAPFVSVVKRWTGTDWVTVGDGFNGIVAALEGFEGELYAGGSFTQQGNDSTELRRLVKWDGQNWVEVTQGLNGMVNALLATPDGLVVGGFFSALDSLSLPGWTVYDGSSFSEPVIDPDHSFIPSAANIVAHPISGFILSGQYSRSVWIDGDEWKEIDFAVLCAVEYGGDVLLGGGSGVSYHPVYGICKLAEGTGQAILDIGNIAAGLAPNSSLFRSKISGRGAFRVPRTGIARSISKAAPWVVGTHMGERYSASPTNGDVGAPQAGPFAVVMDDDFFTRYYQVWKLDQTMIAYHAAHWSDPDYEAPHSILTWPGNGVAANGEPARIAPFADLNGNELYEPSAGEYPLIRGDQAIYSIQHSVPDQSELYPLMQLELGIMIYAYDEPANADLHNTVFANFTVISRGPEDYTDVRFGLFSDLDLGNPGDDYLGCDSLQSLYYVYNADDVDGTYAYYGYVTDIPAQGAMFLNREMSAFKTTGYTITLDDVMDGTQQGVPIMQTGYPSHFQYPGGFFTEEAMGNYPINRAGVGSIGPLTLNTGDTLCVDMAFPFALAPSGNRLESLDALILRSAAIHAWYATQAVQCDEIPNLIAQLKEATPLEMALYPVPAQDQVMVRCPHLNSGAELQLLNGMGQVVRTLAWPAGGEEMRVDLDGVPNGLYIVRLSNASDRLTRSLVVLH